MAGRFVDTHNNNNDVDKVARALAVGFGALVFIIIIVLLLSLGQHRTYLATINQIAYVDNEKIAHVESMREGIRQRWNSVRRILDTNDPFVRDAQVLNYFDQARIYREARQKLQELPMDREEQSLHERLDRLAMEYQARMDEVIIRLADETPFDELRELFELGIEGQDHILRELNTLSRMQHTAASHAADQLAQTHRQQTVIMTLLGLLVVMLSVGIARYVTAYVTRQNAALSDAMAVKSRFLAIMSHEIRTPLTAITGFAELLLHPNTRGKQREEAIRTILRNGTHLHQVVNEILDLSKLEASRLNVENVEVHPLEVLDDVVSVLRMQAREKGLTLEVQRRFPLPAVIRTDPVRLKQILLNLGNNAIKFTEHGQIRITMSADPISRQLRIEVIDTGIGISRDELARLFHPFTQADASITRRFGGTGLGLYLSREMARLLGGEIEVQSKPHEGSCFTVVLDTGDIDPNTLLEAMPQTQATPDTNTSAIDYQALGGRILLAEDTPDNQLLFATYLGKTCAQVECVDNGQAAVKAALAGEYDLVLMDMQMPVMGGLDAVQALRTAGFDKPIIMLTANAFKEDHARCLEAGCNGFISKPVRLAAFLESVAPYLPAREPDLSGAGPLVSELATEGELFRPAIKCFIDDLPQVRKSLNEAAQRQSWQEVAELLHRLKGSGGGMGYPQVTDLARHIEHLMKNGAHDKLLEPLQAMDRLIERIQAGAQLSLSSSRKD
jgi:signal transduction histidine kinase/HPt (histidine-containing phosphotransfer) domain-containing protein/ActR/RegA family two-component response regulator